MTPPMYDVTNIDIWKAKMSMYRKTLGMHVYLVTTKKPILVMTSTLRLMHKP